MVKARTGSVSLSAAGVAALVAGVIAMVTTASPGARQDTIPDRLADSTFWRIVSTFSEPTGYFPSENFVSNETEWQYVIPGALSRVKPGGAYVGVGPEQNFTYIASFHPRIAFICDIRRQNLIQHLMYKALIEMSANRAEFLSKLWSRLRPDGTDTMSDPAEIVAAFRRATPDSLLYNFNLASIFTRLVDHHKFELSADDSATMRAVYRVFFLNGPDISYSSSSRTRGIAPGGALVGPGTVIVGSRMTWSASGSGVITTMNGGGATTYRFTTDSLGRMVMWRDSSGTMVPDTTFKLNPLSGAQAGFATIAGGGYATFGSLMSEDDGAGVNRGWLGSEAAFRYLKDFETRNLLVPVVGNFGGSKALRSVASYLKANDVHVSEFYTSNVEQYLFQNRIDGEFYDNVAALPTDSSSIFIRSFPASIPGAPRPRVRGSRLAQTTSSIGAILKSYREGTLTSYFDLAALQDR
jgi:hypothetical protein